MKKIVTLSLAATTLLFGSAYRLPEGSINSTALSGAYISNAHGADSSYYNPANMVFNEDKNELEAALTYINLSKIKYTDAQNPAFNSTSKSENIFAPMLFFSSKDYNNLRYGFAVTVPGGLRKRWESPYAKAFAKEFELKIVEFNPSIAYKISDQFAVGAGVRAVYSDGVVKSDATDISKPAIRDMKADTTEFGYNVALTYKLDQASTFSATYRSNVDLNHEGNAKLYLSGTKLYDGGASVEVPLPAVLALAFSYNFDKTTVELEWDKTYWSEYKKLDFEFKDKVPTALKAAFDDPKEREWKDTNAFRLGITHRYSDKLTLMASIAKDDNPAPDRNLGFELPDSDAMIYAGGFSYKVSDKLSFGASILYDKKDSRSVNQRSTSNPAGIYGEFKDASATLITTGVRYAF